jgi:hypothetical protein
MKKPELTDLGWLGPRDEMDRASHRFGNRVNVDCPIPDPIKPVFIPGRFLPVARDSGTITKGDRVTQLFGSSAGVYMRIDADTHNKPQGSSPLVCSQKNWADVIHTPAPFLPLVLANASGTGTAGNDIGVQRDRTIPRQRPAFQIHAGGYCDGCQRQDVPLEYRVCSQGR